MLDRKGINKYIRQCIEDAYVSEGRKYKPENISKDFYYVVVNMRYFVFNICTPYERVNRRVTYRIKKNFKKNFGLKAMTCAADVNYEAGYTFERQNSLEIKDVNFTRNAFELKGRKNKSYVLLKDFRFLEEDYGDYIPAIVYEKVAIARLGKEEFIRRLEADELIFDKPLFFNEYKELFKKAFGWDVGVYILAHSDNLVELGRISYQYHFF